MANYRILLRKIHYWGAIVAAVPLLIIIITGIFLQAKKHVAWVQPSTQKGTSNIPSLSFDKILEITKNAQKNIDSWNDIDRLDVRPGKGIIKVRGKNGWEIQIDSQNGNILQIAYRRSDLIESIHDGSFFSDYAKLWLFLPSAIILLILWITGIYLFFLPIISKRKRKRK